MLKVFQAAESGESAEFWDANWARTELADPITVCEQDPVWPLVMRTVRPGDRFLEGGCGQGQWVRYLTARGQAALGVDFAENNIARLRSAYPECRFELGDITKLTLPDGSVDVYYSAGVVEHFERGPDVALREAHRVLRPGGTFLCSVPDASPLRRFLYRRDRGVHASTGWRVRHVERTEEEAAPGGLSFFQYMFAEDEFRARLEAAGFVVKESIGLYLTWGLLEIPTVSALFPLARRLGRKLRGRARVEASEAAPQAAPSQPRAQPNVPIIRRVLVNEDRDVPLLGQAIKLGARLFPNMRMYVATRA